MIRFRDALIGRNIKRERGGGEYKRQAIETVLKVLFA